LEYDAIPREPSIVGVGVAQQALEILLAVKDAVDVSRFAGALCARDIITV
jgi:hypothetical protein